MPRARPAARVHLPPWVVVAAIGLCACSRTPPAEGSGSLVAHGGSVALAGAAPGGPRPDLSPEQRAAFETGRIAFVQAYTPETGLGPRFNETACVTCHDQPGLGGHGTLERSVHLIRDAGDVRMVQRRAIAGHAPRPLPTDQLVVTNRPPPLFGLGLLDAIPDDVLRAGCDPDDRDGDGVRGRVNVNPGRDRPGRFGFKSHAVSLRDFIANALSMEMGITNPVERDPLLVRDDAGPPDPEVPEAVVDQLTAFVAGLAPPGRQGDHPKGEALFARIGCATCHRPQTAPGVPAYTDLCLHDLGPQAAGLPDFLAGPSDWRTAPLWGLRWRPFYLHDGRARSLEEAVRQHGGEAAAARDRFAALPESERRDLLAFLATL